MLLRHLHLPYFAVGAAETQIEVNFVHWKVLATCAPGSAVEAVGSADACI